MRTDIDFEWKKKYRTLKEFYDHEYDKKYYSFNKFELEIDPMEPFEDIEKYSAEEQQRALPGSPWG